jgi:GNAT superfamily N-acetyltransferase
MNKVNIRRAVIDDAAAVAKLSETLGYPVTTEEIGQRLERLLKRDDQVVFVAETDEIAGWTHAAEQEILELDRFCEIWGLVVGEKYRRSGIGRQLIEAAEQWARSRGLTRVMLRSNIVRAESHPFYERIGYTRYKTQHAYRKCL